MKNITKGLVLLALVPISQLYAEVTVDGSLGGGSQSLSGPKYDINESLGERQGANLFHSFSAFNINTGEEAQFSTDSATNNIFARVTGGESSLINGKISVENSPANLWLMNPAGWIVGKGASINVQGAFHLTTANAIGFGDGGVFFADPVSQSVLSADAPIDYQFDQGEQATITLDQADLIMPEGQDITLMGGDIDMQNSRISAPGGRVVLASNAGEGTWQIDDTGVTQLSGGGGVINIEHDTPAGISSPSISSSDADTETSSGGIQLTAAQISLKNATLLGQAWEDTNAGDTELQAEQTQLTNSFIRTEVLGSKDGGQLKITGQDLTLSENSIISSDTNEGSTGLGGDMIIDLQGNLSLSEESSIAGVVSGNDGGDIRLNANKVALNDNSSLSVATLSDGSAGNISVDAEQLQMKNGGTIDSSTLFEMGQGGDISISVDNISLSQKALISSESVGAGKAGIININADNLSLDNQSNIRAKSKASGATGEIDLTVASFLELHSDSKVTTEANETNGGPITVNSGTLVLDRSAIITSVFGSQGDGGNISVNAGSLVMNTGFIQANTDAVGGSGGTVEVNAGVTLASQGLLLKGTEERFDFDPDSRLNVIQAVAPEGFSGEVTVDTVELNLAEQLAKVDSSFVVREKIADDPCSVARGEQRNSLVQTGLGGVPVKASDGINLPLQRYLPKDNVKPQSKITPEMEKLAVLSASSLCQQEQY